jgi:hypothetical protein
MYIDFNLVRILVDYISTLDWHLDSCDLEQINTFDLFVGTSLGLAISTKICF